MDNFDKKLEWDAVSSEKLGDYRIFSVSGRRCRAPDGREREFTVIDTHDWALIVPVLETERGREFVMVKQWRPGEGGLSIEFPGGVIEDGESIEKGAERELREETGYKAGKLTHLASMNPNPAIMSNRIHFFLAEDLFDTGAQELDEDELVEFVHLPVEDVARRMGKAPFIHALTATALLFFGQVS
jgi:8-oxo-dGTP pyrophosphatase MutT (NUDIX family)